VENLLMDIVDDRLLGSQEQSRGPRQTICILRRRDSGGLLCKALARSYCAASGAPYNPSR
jgi:hypothetical protein